jgi:polar amino acid transport system substrate-binding protein
LKYLSIVISIVAVLIMTATIGCGGASPSSQVTPPASTLPPGQTTPAVSPTPQSTTTADLSTQGQKVYANSCARCHGASGQGGTASALWGSAVSLGKYNTAQGLFTIISTTMPFNAPGSLTIQQYQQLLIYILVQNQFVQPGATIDFNNLASIPLK